MTKEMSTKNAKATEQLAEKIGRHLRGGEVIELISDLGGGKTTFTRGLGRAIGSPDRVASPTFTISKVYEGQKLAIHHFDFYRLDDAGLMAHELHDVVGDPKIVIVIEWGDVVAHVLPADRFTVHLMQTGDESRRLTLDYPESLAYLMEDVA